MFFYHMSTENQNNVFLTKNKKTLIISTVSAAVVIASIILVYYSSDFTIPSEASTIEESPMVDTESPIVDTENPPVSNDNPVVAVVNDEEIRFDLVEQSQNMIQLQTGQVVDQDTTLDRLVTKTLLLQEAENRGITIPQTQAKSEFERRISQSGMSLENLKQQLQQQGTSYQETVMLFQEQLIINELLGEVISGNNIQVTDNEAKLFFEDNLEIIQNQVGSNVTYEVVSNQIKSHISQQKQEKLVSDFISDLEGEADITTFKDRM